MRRCCGLPDATDRIYELKGKSTRPGVRKCGHCRKPFTVTVGTVFERSHIPLHKWMQAFYLLCCSKKGISSHQLHRILCVSYKAAWFMSHRIREAMRSGELAPMGGLGGIVEVDETFIGNDRTIKPHREKRGRGYAHKHKVLALVDRNAGTARTMVVDDLKVTTLTPILTENIAREARVMTDEAGYYTKLGESFASHEFGRAARSTPTPSKAFFSIFKRGMKGVQKWSMSSFATASNTTSKSADLDMFIRSSPEAPLAVSPIASHLSPLDRCLSSGMTIYPGRTMERARTRKRSR